MPKVTFSMKSVVFINVRGAKVKDKDVRDDGGLVGKLFEFITKEGLYPPVRVGGSGAGRYYHFHSKKDAEKIKDWLVSQGAKRTGR